MTRYIENRRFQYQVEATYGTDPGSWVATHNVPILADPRWREVPMMRERNRLRGYFGADASLHAYSTCEADFSVEIAGSGTADTPPAWGPLIRTSGFTQSIVATNRVDYTLQSSNFTSGYARYEPDGVIRSGPGMLLDATFRLNAFDIPTIAFSGMGLQPTNAAGSLVAGNFAAWRDPLAINEANGSVWKLGSSHAAGVISGGTTLLNGNMEVRLGFERTHVGLLNGRRIEPRRRRATITGTLFLTAAEEIARLSAMRASTLTTLSFEHGAGAGNIFGMFIAGAQISNIEEVDFEGRVAYQLNFNAVALSGNDELRFWTK